MIIRIAGAVTGLFATAVIVLVVLAFDKPAPAKPILMTSSDIILELINIRGQQAKLIEQNDTRLKRQWENIALRKELVSALKAVSLNQITMNDKITRTAALLKKARSRKATKSRRRCGRACRKKRNRRRK